MSIVIFQEITTEEILTELEADGVKYQGLYVDMNDAKQRKYVKDSAAKVTEMLKRLDRARIDKSKDYKVQVESEAKSIRERLEAANEPFTALIDLHKAERAQVLAAAKAKQDAIDLAKLIESDHEIAQLMYQAYLTNLKEKEAAELKAQQERDAEIARLAAAEATRLTEEKVVAIQKKAEDERLAAIREQEQSKLREEQAKQAVIDANIQREKDATEAEERRKQAAIDAKAEAERQAKEAVKREQDRIEQERIAEQKEQERRERNTKHRGSVNREILAAMVKHTGVTEKQAKDMIKAMVNNLVPNITINY